MKIFLSSLELATSCKAEGRQYVAEMLVEQGVQMKYNLMSYYYIRNRLQFADFVREHSQLVLIDSGAHSFQKGAKVDWDAYTDEYAEFIKRYDRPNVLGYFEMDVDNIIGYQNVLRLRKKLEAVSDKIIPVWHKNRGIDDYKDMCRKYAGKVIAITGFRNMDIAEEQYPAFLKYAWQCGCKVHCLGMTRKSVLDKVPFDFCDSSSWSAEARSGRVDGGRRTVTREMTRTRMGECYCLSYKTAMKMQEKYERKWQRTNFDVIQNHRKK